MSDFESRIVQMFNISKLFDYQKQVLETLCSTKSLFVCQRTGRCKSLCYEAFSTDLNLEQSIVLVASPLLSIMEDQILFLASKGISAVKLNEDYKMDANSKAGKYQYIYGSPEVFLGQDDWRETLKSKIFQYRVKLIAVDEAHLVVQW